MLFGGFLICGMDMSICHGVCAFMCVYVCEVSVYVRLCVYVHLCVSMYVCVSGAFTTLLVHYLTHYLIRVVAKLVEPWHVTPKKNDRFLKIKIKKKQWLVVS